MVGAKVFPGSLRNGILPIGPAKIASKQFGRFNAQRLIIYGLTPPEQLPSLQRAFEEWLRGQKPTSAELGEKLAKLVNAAATEGPGSEPALRLYTNVYWGGNETWGSKVNFWKTDAAPRRAHSNVGAIRRKGAKVNMGTIKNPRMNQRFKPNITTATRIRERICRYVNAAGSSMPRYRRSDFNKFGDH